MTRGLGAGLAFVLAVSVSLYFLATPVAASRIQIEVDTPAAGAGVPRSVTVSGWAVDLDSTRGPGLAAVTVAVDQEPSQAGPGATARALYGLARPDVAAVLGDAFLNSGYTVTLDLSPGPHILYLSACPATGQCMSTRLPVVVETSLLDRALGLLADFFASENLGKVVPFLTGGGLQIGFGPLPADVIAQYNRRQNAITINYRFRDSDPYAIADVLAHEATHALAAQLGLDAGCVEEEYAAFQFQVRAWIYFTERGTPNPSDPLVRYINRMVRERAIDPIGWFVSFASAYADECGL